MKQAARVGSLLLLFTLVACGGSDGAKDPYKLHNQAKVLFEKGQVEESLALLDDVLEALPDFAEAHFSRALVLTELERHEEALREEERAIQLRPDYFEAHVNKGHSLLQLERFTEAAAAANEAVRINPASPNGHYLLGVAYSRLGRNSKALAAMEKTLELDPTHTSAAASRRKIREVLESEGALPAEAPSSRPAAQ